VEGICRNLIVSGDAARSYNLPIRLIKFAASHKPQRPLPALLAVVLPPALREDASATLSDDYIQRATCSTSSLVSRYIIGFVNLQRKPFDRSNKKTEWPHHQVAIFGIEASHWPMNFSFGPMQGSNPFRGARAYPSRLLRKVAVPLGTSVPTGSAGHVDPSSAQSRDARSTSALRQKRPFHIRSFNLTLGIDGLKISLPNEISFLQKHRHRNAFDSACSRWWLLDFL
jgi:hypothetical protein